MFLRPALCAALLLLPLAARAQPAPGPGSGTAAPGGTASVAAMPLLVQGAGSERRLRCEGQDVEIAGAGHRVTLEGRCGTVRVMGAEQTVELDSAARLEVSGARNRVSASGTLGGLVVQGQGHRISGTTPEGAPTEAEVVGEGSELRLRLGGPARLTLAGARHRVLWTAAEGVPAPQGDLSGIGHVVERDARP